jgi:drug/metabolite transporter (DMT)-like permease
MKQSASSSVSIGWASALLSPVFLGLTPILAKVAYEVGVDVMSLVVIRTLFAAAVLWLIAALFGRKLISSSTPGIVTSMIAGGINGIGSIFFYASLMRIDASLGQLINITYLIWVTFLLRLFGQKVSLLTIIRVLLAVLAVYLLTQGGLGEPDWIGVGMMLVGAISYAIQLVLSQRIMLDIPAPTMTLYAMSGMAAIVSIAWLFLPTFRQPMPAAGWSPVLWMGLITAAARLTLFLGVKHLGSLQTALLGMLEVLITIGLAGLLLGERLTEVQWLGAVTVVVSIILVRYERDVPRFVDWWGMIYSRLKRNP